MKFPTAKLAATACAIFWASASLLGCSAYSNETADEPVPELEDLSLEVTSVLLRRGEIQISANTYNGSANVSLWAGGEACGEQELGHGIATPGSFVWSLDRRDVVLAIHCGIVVKAHGLDDEGHRVKRTRNVPFSVTLLGGDSEDIAIDSQETGEEDATLVFRSVRRETHLLLGSSVIGAEDEDDEASNDDEIRHAKFVVGHDDLADALLGRRTANVGGSHFPLGASVDGTFADLVDADAVAEGDGDGEGSEGEGEEQPATDESRGEEYSGEG